MNGETPDPTVSKPLALVIEVPEDVDTPSLRQQIAASAAWAIEQRRLWLDALAAGEETDDVRRLVPVDALVIERDGNRQWPLGLVRLVGEYVRAAVALVGERPDPNSAEEIDRWREWWGYRILDALASVPVEYGETPDPTPASWWHCHEHDVLMRETCDHWPDGGEHVVVIPRERIEALREDLRDSEDEFLSWNAALDAVLALAAGGTDE